MKEFKVEEWDGKDIKGLCVVSYKIDGIFLRRNSEGKYVSKGGKPVYNLPEAIIDPAFKYAEVYCGSWNETMSLLFSSKNPKRPIRLDEIFILEYGADPDFLRNRIDPRLFIRAHANLSSDQVNAYLELALKEKHEGLVINVFGWKSPNMNGILVKRRIKVKPVQTVDVKVTGIVKSTAKSHYGYLKEFETEFGKVGIGLTRDQRRKYMTKRIIGKVIEVEVIGGYTKNNKFRHARFVRVREDKS